MENHPNPRGGPAGPWSDWPFWFFAVLFAIALGATLIASSNPELRRAEEVLLLILSLVAGSLVSYRFGRINAREAALEVIRPHARSALRRILVLRDSLYRLSARIEELKEDYPDYRLDIIQAVIEEQIPTGGSAVEDWRDIVPEDVDEILQQWPNRWGADQNGTAD